MGKKAKPAKHYDDLKAASGWYLAAWRDFRGLSQLELAEAIGTSKGQVSDLENGAVSKKGVQTRYNRDWLEKCAEELKVRAGDLLDTNPFRDRAKFEISDEIERLGDRDLATVADLVRSLSNRTGTAG